MPDHKIRHRDRQKEVDDRRLPDQKIRHQDRQIDVEDRQKDTVKVQLQMSRMSFKSSAGGRNFVLLNVSITFCTAVTLAASPGVADHGDPVEKHQEIEEKVKVAEPLSEEGFPEEVGA